MGAITEARAAKLRAARECLAPYLKPGVILTHTRCMGVIEEHFYTGDDGLALCGMATPDTIAMGGSSCGPTNDISPESVTHINRIPVDALDIAEIVPIRTPRSYFLTLPCIHGGSVDIVTSRVKALQECGEGDGTIIFFGGGSVHTSLPIEETRRLIERDLQSDYGEVPF